MSTEKQPTTNHTLQAALDLAESGWNVFPLRPNTKVPQISKKAGGKGAHDGTTDPEQITKWWENNPKRGIGANLGDDLIAFDIDVQNGGFVLDSFPETLTHHSGRGNGNQHLIYRYEPRTLTSRMRSGTNVLGPGVDVRIGRGSYIVLPPTKHEATGKPYTVGTENDGQIATLTDQQLLDLFDEVGLEAPSELTRSPAAAQPRVLRPVESEVGTVLDDLLSNPPSEGGRNDWLARVCGHLAKKHRDDRAVYDQQVDQANSHLRPPLEEFEVKKTKDSIWDSEVQNHPERGASLENGFLVSHQGMLHCVILEGRGDEAEYSLEPWSDFDLTTEGVAVDDDHHRTYWVTLHWSGQRIQTTIDGETLADDRAFKKWLGAFGASYETPPNTIHKVSPSTRVLRYLNSQKPPRVQIVTTLGYQQIDQGHGFVTQDGVITKNGYTPKEESGVVLDPQIVRSQIANYRYGFKQDRQAAVDVLRKVLGFQFPEVSSVFSAWWAACLLKPQISDYTSLFPILGVQAASESGKTTGFFDLMVRLNGNNLGHVTPTRPVLRDYAGANYNGIVWVDDLDDLSSYEELLRTSTTNGFVAKMDADNSSVKAKQIVAPIFISGESLGFDSQKALADRAVVISAPSPKQRTTDDGRLQWEDIVELQNEYRDTEGGLSSLSGWFVQDALKWQKEVIRAISKYKTSGRSGSKHGVLVAGACLVESILAGEWVEEGKIVKEVRKWVQQDRDVSLDQDNALTRELLPWALRQWGMPDSVEVTEGGRYDGLRTPVILRPATELLEGDYEVWYSVTMLADAWDRNRAGRVKTRVESLGALQDQSRVLGGDRKSFRVSGTRQTVKMRRLPTEYVATVLERTGLGAD